LACAGIFLSVHGMQGRTYSHFPRSLRNIPALGDQKIRRERFDESLAPLFVYYCHCTRNNMMQHTATHCITLQHTTCNTLQQHDQHTATHRDTLQHPQHPAAQCCNNMIQHTATHFDTLHATRCNNIISTLQHTATHCNTLQYTATHCDTLRHTATYYMQHAVTSCNTKQPGMSVERHLISATERI